jgi:hypothetical protein
MPAVPASALVGFTSVFTVTGVQSGWSDGRVFIYGFTGSTGCPNAGFLARPANADTTKIANLASAALLSGHKLTCYLNGRYG